MTTRGQSGADQASSNQRLTALAPHAGSKIKKLTSELAWLSVATGNGGWRRWRRRRSNPAFHPSASPSSPYTQTNNGGRVMRLPGASEDTR